ncbi:hypothetical protein [Acetivibrio thermocellus]|jgi:hypothetical protein|uniref:hypothetical protein n=1 Tax=Acetivibrio thermocellus TaxID=1515 RepID=UPI00003C8E0A|nr:hypothetical protein [Acetivibrio thermocellus]
MDEKSFASEILKKTIDKLNSLEDWTEEYSRTFKDLFEQEKYDSQEEISRAIGQVVENYVKKY